jgi:TPR repeat protein
LPVKDFLKNGDFASARLLLRQAAEAGSADATLMFGETFDPLVMHELGAIGISPDIAQASQWHEKAAKLGSDVATRRLAKLAATGRLGGFRAAGLWWMTRIIQRQSIYLATLRSVQR